GQLRVSTVALYERNLRTYVYPRFGDKPVGMVTRDDVRTLVADLLGKGKSRSLVRNVVAPIRQTFNQLAEDGAVVANPAAAIGRFVKGKGDARARVDPLTPAEEATFLDTALITSPRYYPLFLTALRTGLRFGELAGLRWGDLDFAGRFIEVRRTLHDGGRV